ncbi:hypothetical protein B0T17DRAFT_588954 [Bombardia bombarda]|uniref:Copper-fist domain-containing protein n=1 Tax=Bombardia bombarda TaxID=252184 RepID=A0AA39X8Q2_9PEZI|nr:hypothetical protein B0T17DRAFT_588954 [Bombardia bombarda]
MPMIHGQKMACPSCTLTIANCPLPHSAPCIRGHRSTKCNHYAERVMVPVRKPGRPLSTCPCPPGRPCVCGGSGAGAGAGGVKVAIPRKQQCLCGPENPKETTSPVEHGRSPTEAATSPIRPSFRINKPVSGSRINGRKQSFDPSTLTRIDPMSVNLVTPPGSLDTNLATMVSNGMGAQMSPTGPSGYGTVGFLPSGPGNTFPHSQGLSYGSPLTYGMSLPYTQAPHMSPQMIKSEEESLSPSQISNMGMPMSSPAVTNGHRHSRSASLGGSQHASELAAALAAKTNGVRVGGSCCDPKGEQPNSKANGLPAPSPVFENPFIPQFTPTTPFEYPTVYTYPANYGSWQHPVDQNIWQQIASQPTMPLEAAASMSPSANGNGGGDLGIISHQCSCGPGCKCVGCLAHPFNEQMFQYVSNAYIENGDSSNGGHSNDSPPEAHTPSDTSQMSDEQSLSTLDYFFVNLPIRMDGGGCAGNINSCLCGSDCQCIGCLVHDAPVPSE